MHQRDFVKILKQKNLDEYHDLYVQDNTLLLADIFENFQNMCLEICEFDPAHFFSTPRLAGQAALKKTKVKLDLLTDIMLLMVEKGRTCHAAQQCSEVNNKYMKNDNKNKESSYLKY